MNELLKESLVQLNDQELSRTVNSIPSLPRSAMLLNRILAQPNFELKDVVRAIELDPALSARVLQLGSGVNYGPRKAGSIAEAVVRLGGGTVRSLAMAQSMRSTLDLDLSFYGMTTATYWKHSVAVVCFAEELAFRRVAVFGTDFSVAAILHDFGKAVIAKHLTPDQAALAEQKYSHLSGSDLERAILRVDHALVGAAVAQGWDLDADLVRAIQYHHCPELFDHPLSHGLNIANQLAWQLEGKTNDLERESASRRASTEALGLSQEKLKTIAEHGVIRLQESLEAYG